MSFMEFTVTKNCFRYHRTGAALELSAPPFVVQALACPRPRS